MRAPGCNDGPRSAKGGSILSNSAENAVVVGQSPLTSITCGMEGVSWAAVLPAENVAAMPIAEARIGRCEKGGTSILYHVFCAPDEGVGNVLPLWNEPLFFREVFVRDPRHWPALSLGIFLIAMGLSCAEGVDGSPRAESNPGKPTDSAAASTNPSLAAIDTDASPINAISSMPGSSSEPSAVVPCNGRCTDFPADPVVDAKAPKAVPADAASRFGAAGSASSGGPCVFEPEMTSIFPRNWLRPRVNFLPAAGDDLFEIGIHADQEAHDLVVYTTSSTWYMPRDLWAAVTSHVATEWVLTVSVRAMSSRDPHSVRKAPDVQFIIAPAEANGTIVYWTPAGTGMLKGFRVGDENVVQALTAPQVAQKTSSCIGCHTSTPDGKYAAFVVPEPKSPMPPNANEFSEAIGSLEPTTAGQTPSFLGAGAKQVMDTAQTGLQTFSPAHWKDGDHVEVAQSGRGRSELFWIDLEAASGGQGAGYGVLQRNGDPRGAGAPSWTHDGAKIFYVSTNSAVDGRIDGTDTDLYSIPYNDRNGGDATKVIGAAEDNWEEFYPAVSGDDQLLVFNRVPKGSPIYNSPIAEVFVVPTEGGTPTRLRANDPPACTMWPGPGPSNTWPKWSPEAQTVNGTKYYFLIFASARNKDYRPQLHMTGVSIAPGSKNLTTYGAVTLWNQPDNESNHTPAWDVFKIPPTPPPADVK